MPTASEPSRPRRLGTSVRAWLAQRWVKRGLGLLVVAVLLQLVAGLVPEPWRWLAIADGAGVTWLGLAALLRPGRRWPRALGLAAAAYLAVVVVLAALGTPATLALGWPYLLVQAAVGCPLGVGCRLG